jgi:hypothetical protein
MTKETIAPNHVLGVVSGEGALDAIQNDLRDMGLPDPILVRDENVGERLEAESTLPMRVLQRLFNHLSEETNYLNQYEEAARQGQTIVAVKADNEDEVELARKVLSRHGAVDIRFFGRLAVSDLTPESNPSAGSDEKPAERPREHS